MTHLSRFLPALAAASLLLPHPARAADTQWMRTGQTGRLVPLLDDRGDRIMDFSAVGYKSGSVPLPNYSSVVPPSAILTLSPLPGDNRAAIQAAIDQVGNLPLQPSGFRGVVQLSAGTFSISDKLSLNKSGVILRGVDDSADPASSTILSYTGTSSINMVEITASITRPTGTAIAITDKVVPAGASSVTVSSTSTWKVGDKITIFRSSPTPWNQEIGMDQLPTPWTSNSRNQNYDRTITHIDQARKRIFFDAPIANSIEKKYIDSQGRAGTVSTYTENRLQNIGVENLRGDGQAVLTFPEDEAYANTFVYIQNTANAFVRNVTGQHLRYATVHTDLQAINVTVDDAQSLDPISVISGERRYAFNMSGQLVLMKNLLSDQGRHDFVNNSPSRGPNVFLDATATNSTNETGPHQRWSTGTLYDNVTTDTRIHVENAWSRGSGHGWTGANMVIWNSKAPSFTVQNPPGSQNWLIGSTGNVSSFSNWGAPPQFNDLPGYYDANNLGPEPGQPNPVTLAGETSLYRAQLAQRLAAPNNQTREYWVGDFDGFQNLAADGDAVPVHSAWSAQIPSLTPAPVTSLDRPDLPGRAVPLTFEYDAPTPAQEIRYALLTLALKTSGPTPEDDHLWIDSTTPIPLSSFTTTTINDTQILTIELFASSASDDLTFLQDGRLNLLLSDDHALDWADLQLTFSPALTGDANRDGLLSPDDAALLDRGRAKNLTGWSNGDFNHDNLVNSADYLIFDTSLAQQQGGHFSPELLAERQSQFGPSYVSELLTSIPEPSTTFICLIAAIVSLRRRHPTAFAPAIPLAFVLMSAATPHAAHATPSFQAQIIALPNGNAGEAIVRKPPPTTANPHHDEFAGALASGWYTVAAPSLPGPAHTFALDIGGTTHANASGSGSFNFAAIATEYLHIEFLPPPADSPNLNGTPGQFRLRLAISKSGNVYSHVGFGYGLFNNLGNHSSATVLDARDPTNAVFTTQLWDFTFGVDQSFNLSVGLIGAGGEQGQTSVRWVGTDVYDQNGNLLPPSSYRFVPAPDPTTPGLPEPLSPLTPGDANADGLLSPDDAALLDRGHALSLTGWSNGDFNHDNLINSADYLLFDTAYANAHGLESVGPLLSHRHSQFGPAYIQSLLTSIPEPSLACTPLLFGLTLLTRRRFPFAPIQSRDTLITTSPPGLCSAQP